RSDVPTARNVLANHIDKLTRTPKDTPDEFRSVRCPGCRSLGGNDRVGPMVAGVGYRVFAPNGADDREFKSWSEMVHANISKNGHSILLGRLVESLLASCAAKIEGSVLIL